MKRTLFALVLMACASGVALAQKPAAPAAPAPGRRARGRDRAGPDSPGQSMIEQDESAMSGRAYSYDPAGRRDPFRSLLVREQNRGGAERPPGIAGIAIDDLVVHGIWKTQGGLRGPDPRHRQQELPHPRRATFSTTARSCASGPTRSRSGRTSTIRRA